MIGSPSSPPAVGSGLVTVDAGRAADDRADGPRLHQPGAAAPVAVGRGPDRGSDGEDLTAYAVAAADGAGGRVQGHVAVGRRARGERVDDLPRLPLVALEDLHLERIRHDRRVREHDLLPAEAVAGAEKLGCRVRDLLDVGGIGSGPAQPPDFRYALPGESPQPEQHRGLIRQGRRVVGDAREVGVGDLADADLVQLCRRQLQGDDAVAAEPVRRIPHDADRQIVGADRIAWAPRGHLPDERRVDLAGRAPRQLWARHDGRAGFRADQRGGDPLALRRRSEAVARIDLVDGRVFGVRADPEDQRGLGEHAGRAEERGRHVRGGLRRGMHRYPQGAVDRGAHVERLETWCARIRGQHHLLVWFRGGLVEAGRVEHAAVLIEQDRIRRFTGARLDDRGDGDRQHRDVVADLERHAAGGHLRPLADRRRVAGGLAGVEGDQARSAPRRVRRHLEQVQQPQAGLVRDLVEAEQQALAEVRQELEQGDAGITRRVVGPLGRVDRNPRHELREDLVVAPVVEDRRGHGHVTDFRWLR